MPQPSFPRASCHMTRAAIPAAVLAALAAALPGCSKPAPPLKEAPVALDPEIPEDMFGVWTATRGMVMRCIELRAGGTFMMAPNTEAGDRLYSSGTWRVAGGKMTWRDWAHGFTPDVNAMESVSPGHFTTVEANGSRTQFDRIAGPGDKCPSEVSR
ncbi:MAG: hypothetical protein JF585_13600 [Burkholderiales bacterium]|nr:hypothetical protein [Burkholderiales bacterium]